MQNSGKDNDGKCQRDFICKEKSHDKFSTKKTCVSLSWRQKKQWKSTATSKIQREVHIKSYHVAHLFERSEVNISQKSATKWNKLSVIKPGISNLHSTNYKSG